jgi:hypothetical protein
MNLKELKQKMPEIFENVREDVRRILGRHRAGLSLGLREMGMSPRGFIGGMHYSPGTEIVMNTSPLKKLLETQPNDIIWAYTYHILLHEYIHSLGAIDEWQCKTITLNISEEVFKDKNHPALILAKNGIGAFFPNWRLLYSPPGPRPKGKPIEYVVGFDRESHSYYS